MTAFRNHSRGDDSKVRKEFFPWSDAMAFGFGFLRLSSDKFWALTPRELDAAAKSVSGLPSLPSPMTRKEFSSLMEIYPDQNEDR